MKVNRMAGEARIVMHSVRDPKRTEETRDVWLQIECIDVLEAFGTDEAVQTLLAIVEQNAASDSSSFDATPVLAAIRTQKPFVLERLYKFCESDSAPVRYAGAAGLGACDLGQDDRALVQLCQMVKDKEWSVRNCALKSLGLIGRRRNELGDQALGCILSCATESNVSVRASVAEALGSLGIPDTFATVEQMLEDPKFEVREAAVQALGGFDEGRALPHLKDPAHSKNETLRCAAVEALTKFSSQEAADILIGVVDDPREDVPQPWGSVHEILAREVKPVDPLIDGVLLKLLHDPSPSVRRLAIVSLGATRRKEAREAVLSMLADPDPKVREGGIEATNEQLFSKDELKHQLSTAATDRDYRPRFAVARRLKDVSIEGAEQLLVKLADDSNLFVRRQAYRALYKVNPDRLREIVSR